MEHIAATSRKATGRLGGLTRASRLSPERRTEIARNAALVRHEQKSDMPALVLEPLPVIVPSPPVEQLPQVVPEQKPRKRDFRRTTLRKLHVTEDDLQRTPRITPILEEGWGGTEVALRAMRFSGAESIVRFLAEFDKLGKDERYSVPMEAFALSCSIDIQTLLDDILSALKNYSANIVKTKAFTYHPGVMQATIDSAMMPNGEQDRRLIHTALGLSPRPKGITIIGNVNRGKEEDAGEEKDEEADLDFLFPALSDTQKSLDRQKPVAMIGAGETEDGE